ncbi:MAG: hypothetical protein HN337_06305 [Deltaproteobacteria bacterium]|jgi:uncharacterized delta-60 repeat protein|nr:hypothetical protein [Deltaproteobacteria bacterium]
MKKFKSTLLIFVSMLVLALSGCAASSGIGSGTIGGDGPGDDGGEAAPTPPADIPTTVEFNSIVLDKSASAKSLTDFLSKDNSLLGPIDNAYNVQEQFKKVGDLLENYSFTPTEDGQTTESFDDIEIEAVQIANYECSGSLTDLPVCLTGSIDGNIFLAMRITNFDNEAWTQWFVIDPDGTSLTGIDPDPSKRGDLLYIKASLSEDTISYDWSGNVAWDDWLVSELEAKCTISNPDSDNTLIKCYKNDWYSDVTQVNAVANENTASLWLKVNALDGSKETDICIDDNGLVVAESNCEYTASDLPAVTATSESNANEILAVENVSVVLPADDETVTLDEELTISWDDRDNSSSYNLYWSTSSDVTKTNGTKVEGVTSPYNHSSLTNGTNYYYVVTAVLSDETETPDSEYATGKPQVDTIGNAVFSKVISDLELPDSDYDFALDVAVDSNNNIYTTGRSYVTATGTSSLVAMKFTSAGAIDTTFNDPNGYVYATPSDGEGMKGDSIFIDNDTDLYMFGAYTATGAFGSAQMAMWKYTLDGSLDTTFNSPDGYLINDDYSWAKTGIINSDGQTIIGGIRSSRTAVWAYLDDTLDTSFSDDGLYTFDPGIAAYTEDIAIDENERIYFVGHMFTDDMNDNEMFLGRLLSNGSLDVGSETSQGFGDDYDSDGFADGYVLFNSDTDDNDTYEVAYYGYGVTVGPNKNIWVGGKYYVQRPDLCGSCVDPGQGIIWRYDVNGQLDTTFGEEEGESRIGYKRLTAEGSYVFVEDIAFDSYDRVIVGTQRGSDAVVWRLDLNGDFDDGFGTAGVAVFGEGNGYSDIPYGVTLDVEGNIVMAGIQRVGETLSTSKIQVWKIE